MSNQPEDKEAARQSRRNFLTKLGIGAAALGATVLPIPRQKKRSGVEPPAEAQEFPDKDSIFHPASDPRQDPRRPQA